MSYSFYEGSIPTILDHRTLWHVHLPALLHRAQGDLRAVLSQIIVGDVGQSTWQSQIRPVQLRLLKVTKATLNTEL